MLWIIYWLIPSSVLSSSILYSKLLARIDRVKCIAETMKKRPNDEWHAKKVEKYDIE